MIATTEANPNQEGGLPQLKPETFETQLAWLVLTFIFLYVVISRVALPKVDQVLEERDENIDGNLDKAEKLRSDVEGIKSSYEGSLTEARTEAQKASMEVKDSIQADIAKASGELEAKLSAQADEAAERISAAKASVMGELDTVATEVATDLVNKLSGIAADDKSVKAAVNAELSARKGA